MVRDRVEGPAARLTWQWQSWEANETKEENEF